MKFFRSFKFVLLLSFFITACSKPATDISEYSDKSYDGLTTEKPIRVDENNQTVTVLATVNGKFFTEGTRHGMVAFDGSNAHEAVFMGLVATKDFYDGLVKIKANPGNNLTSKNAAENYVTGEPLVMTVKWEGTDRAYDVNEVIIDSNKKPIALHFGGNLAAAEKMKTGCLVCLDSCPVGFVSNSAYTYGAVEKRKEVSFTASNKILPPAGTLVAVTFSLKDKGKTE